MVTDVLEVVAVFRYVLLMRITFLYSPVAFVEEGYRCFILRWPD